MDAGFVANTATARAQRARVALRRPRAAVLHGHAGEPRPPPLSLTKSAPFVDVNGDGHTDLGDTITWSFLVQDTGTVSVTGVGSSMPRPVR